MTTRKLKTLALAVALMAADNALAAEHGFMLHPDMMIADASGSAARAFAFAGTPDVLGNVDWIRFMSMEMGDGGKVVKDAPFSAEAITETSQMLTDGNRISRKSAALLYRDALGRTRQEQTAPGGTVFINDPVAGKRTVLDVEKKTATTLPDFGNLNSGARMNLSKVHELARLGKAQVIGNSADGDTQVLRGDDGETIIKKGFDSELIIRRGPGGEAQVIRNSPDGEQIIRRGAAGEAPVLKKGEDGQTEIISEPGRKIIIHRRQVTRGDGAKADESKDVKISVVRAHGGDEAIAIAGLPLDINALVNLRTGQHNGVTTSLGIKDIGGVKAEGTQTIAIIAAGDIGNDKPIQIVSEKWVSPELQAVVYSRHSDPRSGETIYRLNNIRRTAQPAELFAVPQGYRIKDSASGVLAPIPAVRPVPAVPPAPPIAPTPPAK